MEVQEALFCFWNGVSNFVFTNWLA